MPSTDKSSSSRAPNDNAGTILELNHVAIHVQDVERSCSFYGDILKLQPLARPAFTFPGAWFRLGKKQELHIIGERGEPVHSHHRGNHFALRTDDLAPWVEHFRKWHVDHMAPKQRPDGAMQLFFRDPDGHVIELFTEPQPGLANDE
jgi:catechol 2,3-dioxygenase-like lactoylglutathione lyase family enzyme